MKAIQYRTPKKPEYVDVTEPKPEAGEVLVRIEAVTTCPHWDLHLMRDEPMFPGVPFEYPFPPGQPGHEAAGTVVAVGRGVERFEPGMRVAAWRDQGQHRPGCYAQYNVFDSDNLLPIPESLPFEHVAPLELAMCVQVAFDRLIEGDLIRRRRIAVSGIGPAGLVAIQMAKAYGAEEVIAIEPFAERRATAMNVGADAAYDPEEPAVRSLRRGAEGAFDASIDCTGLKRSIEYLMDRTKLAVSIFGVLREDIVFGPRHWNGLGVLGYGTHNRSAAMRALDLITSEKLELAPLVTEVFPLTEYRAGVELLASKRAIKVCFTPWAD